jgi:hypothetical protein
LQAPPKRRNRSTNLVERHVEGPSRSSAGPQGADRGSNRSDDGGATRGRDVFTMPDSAQRGVSRAPPTVRAIASRAMASGVGRTAARSLGWRSAPHVGHRGPASRSRSSRMRRSIVLTLTSHPRTLLMVSALSPRRVRTAISRFTCCPKSIRLRPMTYSLQNDAKRSDGRFEGRRKTSEFANRALLFFR